MYKRQADKYRDAANTTSVAVSEILGYPVLTPQGGLFTCVNVGRDGAAFVQDVLTHTGVLFVPGWGFGRTVRNAVRVSYGPLVEDHGRIVHGIRKVAAYLRA